MIDHVWTVVCSRAVIDSVSNNMSLHDVIEQLTIRDEPRPDGMLPIQLEVATLWARSDFDAPSQGCGRFTLLSPSGIVAPPFDFDVDLSKFKRTRTRLVYQGFPAREPGRHIFRVELQNEGETEWHQVAATPLEVIFVPPEAEQ